MPWVRTYSPVATQWINWPQELGGWALWRYAQTDPESVAFRDIEDVQHREGV
jgi:hypothetical protein